MMRDRILGMLQQSGSEFISGEYISSQLGITRAAVWKHMQALQCEGVEIEAITRRGYRLLSQSDAPLRASLIAPHLTTKALGRNIAFLPSAPSTNTIAKQLAKEGCAHGTIVLTEEQTAGRGRRGRSWLSTSGKDILMSAVLRPHLEAQFASRYTIATALGVYRLVASLGLVPSIKWPNDVLLGGKKLCGILLELEGTMDAIESIIIGCGLNINTASIPDDIREIATSLHIASGRTFERAQLTGALLNGLEPLYDACERSDTFTDLLREYQTCCTTIGQEITVTGVQGATNGKAEGVDEIGRLLLRAEDGALHAISAGDVTLRRMD